MNLPDPGPIRVTSELPADQLDALETLLFFNENQGEYRDVIVRSIEEFGEPRIKDHGGRLRLHTRHLGEVQALYAMEQTPETGRLIGIVAYARTDRDTATVLHVVVHADFSASGPFAGALVSLRLIREVVKSVSRIKGIERVELLYGVGGDGRTVIRLART